MKSTASWSMAASPFLFLPAAAAAGGNRSLKEESLHGTLQRTCVAGGNGWVRRVLDSSVKEGSNIFISCFARRRSPSRGAYICTTRTHKWAYLWRCNFNFEANVKPPI